MSRFSTAFAHMAVLTMGTSAFSIVETIAYFPLSSGKLFSVSDSVLDSVRLNDHGVELLEPVSVSE